MKITLAAIGFLMLANLATVAQTKPDTAAESEFSVIERGPHHRIVQRVRWEADVTGTPRAQTNSYHELATGMHYRDGDQWLESDEKIEVLPNNAGAAASKGQHKAIFPPDVYDGQIELNLPDGGWLRSRVLGLSYLEPDTGQNVLLAEITNSVGEIHGDNVVIYPNAFTDFEADLRYTYTREGFEQDVVLRGKIPLPEEFGLNPKTTRLQVLTEFFNPPTPKKTDHVIKAKSGGGIPDQTLTFGGEMQIGTGKAFPQENSKGDVIPVGKQWLKIEGRDFLIEEVQATDLLPFLEDLPQRGASLEIAPAKTRRTASIDRQLPVRRRLATVDKKPFRIAALTRPRKGFVLDYITLNTSLTNYTFKGDTTYYLSGNVSLNGTNSFFEGGTVLKYASNVVLTVKTPVTWLGTPYRPVALLSKNDGSVGEGIAGANNDTTNHAAATALYFDATTAGTNLVLQNLRIGQAKTAVAISGGSGHVLSHVQMVNCGNGLALTNAEAALRNALLARVLTNFTGSSATGRVEHLTSDRASYINAGLGGNLFITNSLFVLVTNDTLFTSVNNHTNTAATGIFTNVGAGSYYLVSGSTNRNAGTTNINPSLLADLKKLTTYPPSASVNQSISSPTAWTQYASRDVDTPDLGYHYDSLDYLINNIGLTSTLTLTNGVAVAVHGNYGISVVPGSKIVSQGTPNDLNVLARYQTVQEQPVTLSGGSPVALLRVDSTNSGLPTVSLRFTDVPVMSGTARDLLNNFDGIPHSISVSLQDCQLRGSAFYVVDGGDYGFVVAMTNNLVERGYIYISRYYANSSMNSVDFRNNLFWRSSISFYYYEDPEGGNPTWSIRDNAFDNCVVTVNGDGYYNFQNSHNGWVGTGVLLYPSEGGDVSPSTFKYATHALGRWYQSSTNFINKGSRTANLAGLYHFTTQTNQVKETNSTVDIGYHYVAVNSSGNPVDTDGDGLADYYEDTNGNGSFATGDLANWNDSDTDDDGVNDGNEIIQGRSPLVSGTTADSGGVIKLNIFTPLK